MLDCSHIPTPYGAATVEYFEGSSTAAGNDWFTWVKPRGKSMCSIVLVGKGGNGGNGVIGANSVSAGGGGGGSGGQSTLLSMPLALLPDRLHISLAGISTTTTLASYIAISPKLTAGAGAPVVNDTVLMVNGGGNGGNGAAGTAGAAGAAGVITSAANCPLGAQFLVVLAGQAGIIGGTNVVGGNLTLPVTGLRVTGGTGGGGLQAAGLAGVAGGSFTVAGQFPTHWAGQGGSVATTPPTRGADGYRPIPGLLYGYGGTGGGTTHGTATGAGLVQASGGNGAPGCGGGGSGGALTGSTPGTAGLGGPSFCIITCW